MRGCIILRRGRRGKVFERGRVSRRLGREALGEWLSGQFEREPRRNQRQQQKGTGRSKEKRYK